MPARLGGVGTPFSLAGRGTAVGFGVLSILAVVAELRGRTAEISLWWIDLRDLPGAVRMAILVALASLLIAWAVHPAPGRGLRRLMAASCLTVAVVALRDSVVFAQAVSAGLVAPAIPVPLSAATAALFTALALGSLRSTRSPSATPRRTALALLVATGTWAILFPLAQMLFFGTTDYRRPADAAVIMGARVYASGQPSPLLADRLRTGIELYRTGLVPVLVMSGGDGSDGFNEAAVMRDAAIAAGVDPGAILLDAAGNTTEVTVRNSLALLAGKDGAPPVRLIAVSQAYHLPRIQLAYANAGIDVLTVPAPEAQPIRELPLFIAREVPAFWSYLLRTCLG